MKIKYYANLALLGLLFSCKTASHSASPKPKPAMPVVMSKPVAVAETKLWQEIGKKSEFEAVKIGSKINVEMDKFVPTLNANFYIENQQKIWVNVTALFMNFARALCTPQGLKAYEKVNSTYIDADYQFVNDLLGVNFINYQVLQNILTGKNFLPVNDSDYLLSMQAENYVLQSKKPQIIDNKGKKTALEVKMIFDPGFKLLNVEVKEQNTPNVLSIDYQNWVQQENNWWPKNLKIVVKKESTKVISIEHNTFEFAKMDTPYNVPNGYTKREL